MWRRIRNWWVTRFTTLYYRREAFHHGRALLYVWRYGVFAWEVWDFGPNTGSDDVDRLLRGVPRRYHLAVFRAAARLLKTTTEWEEAKALV